jgi:hypothetical protein
MFFDAYATSSAHSRFNLCDNEYCCSAVLILSQSNARRTRLCRPPCLLNHAASSAFAFSLVGFIGSPPSVRARLAEDQRARGAWAAPTRFRRYPNLPDATPLPVRHMPYAWRPCVLPAAQSEQPRPSPRWPVARVKRPPHCYLPGRCVGRRATSLADIRRNGANNLFADLIVDTNGERPPALLVNEDRFREQLGQTHDHRLRFTVLW